MTTTPSTPPENYTPAPWVAQFSKRELCWLAETLRNRQEAARQDAREARNAATAAQARLSIIEAHRSTREDQR